MQDPEHARLMLDLARGDLAVLEALRNASDQVSAAFGFHAQQAVEKALKGWLSRIGVQYPLTHRLQELFDLLADADVKDSVQFAPLRKLTPYAVQYRYEDLGPSEGLDRAETIRDVLELIEFIERL